LGFFWLALIGGHIVAGLRGFGAAFDHTPKATGTDTYCGTDAILGGVLGVPDGSRKILDAFAQLPSSGPVVVLWPKDRLNVVIAPQLVSYLEWPRQVLSVPIDTRFVEGAAHYYNRPPFAAVVYLVPNPPAARPGSKNIPIGRMIVAPVVPDAK